LTAFWSRLCSDRSASWSATYGIYASTNSSGVDLRKKNDELIVVGGQSYEIMPKKVSLEKSINFLNGKLY